MRGEAGPNQEDCSYCLVKFDGRNKAYWCEFCGCLHLTCAGLKAAKQNKEPFTCTHCLQRPDVQAHLANPHHHSPCKLTFQMVLASRPE